MKLLQYDTDVSVRPTSENETSRKKTGYFYVLFLMPVQVHCKSDETIYGTLTRRT